jgi:NAD(P)-dependent dehydrogenase (short-subunit alcohol dehydrogenase family)
VFDSEPYARRPVSARPLKPVSADALICTLIVQRLAQAGASVVLTGRGMEALERVEADIVAAGGNAVGVQADAGSIADTRRTIDLAVSRFGGIDILVKNAAVFPPRLSSTR